MTGSSYAPMTASLNVIAISPTAAAVNQLRKQNPANSTAAANGGTFGSSAVRRPTIATVTNATKTATFIERDCMSGSSIGPAPGGAFRTSTTPHRRHLVYTR